MMMLKTNNKMRLLLSLVFVIATTVLALHELQHIDTHSSSSCVVCVVDEHSLSFDINKALLIEVVYFYEEIKTTKEFLAFIHNRDTNHANAPPKLS